MADANLFPSSITDARTPGYQAAVLTGIRNISLGPLLVYVIDNVDASALPALAEQFNVYGRSQWQLCQTDTDKRNLIKQAIALHRRKGTPWSIKQAILAIGFDAVDLVVGDPTWRDLRLFVRGRPITANDAALIKDVVDEFAPARCRLNELSYGQVDRWGDGRKWGANLPHPWGGYAPYSLV